MDRFYDEMINTCSFLIEEIQRQEDPAFVIDFKAEMVDDLRQDIFNLSDFAVSSTDGEEGEDEMIDGIRRARIFYTNNSY